MHKTSLILASSSIYRKQLLNKLKLTFTCQSPNIDESLLRDETPSDAVARLALNKAIAVATNAPNNCLIISSDQMACLDNHILTKPITEANAIQQLQMSSGRSVTFLTSLCVYNNNTQKYQLHVEPFSVKFRELSTQDIKNYIKIDHPLDCAGSFKAESIGIALFEKMEGRDSNSLIGLPLIQLITFLKNEGVDVLNNKG
jgi:MAF protein